MEFFGKFKTSRLIGRWFVLSLIAMAAFAVMPSAHAALVNLGACPYAADPSTQTPCDATGLPAGTLLASLVAPVVSSNGLVNGSLMTAVYRESGGTLDFYYQLTTNATSANCGGPMQPACDPVSRVTMFNYLGFLTQLDDRTDATGAFVATLPPNANCPATVGGNPNPNPGCAPFSADASGSNAIPVADGSADTIGYTFNPPLNDRLLPGETSATMVISTNATNFRAGIANVIDGGTTTVASFQPSSAVPEPGSLALIGGGLLALAGIRRKFKRG